MLTSDCRGWTKPGRIVGCYAKYLFNARMKLNLFTSETVLGTFRTITMMNTIVTRVIYHKSKFWVALLWSSDKQQRIQNSGDGGEISHWRAPPGEVGLVLKIIIIIIVVRPLYFRRVPLRPRKGTSDLGMGHPKLKFVLADPTWTMQSM